MPDTLDTLQEVVIKGDRTATLAGVEQALSEGLDAETILNQALIAAMEIVGERFDCGEYFVPEMMVAARAMQAGLDLLQPHLAEANAQTLGTVALGTVKGDLHDIGKNLVGMMLEGAGFSIIDLETNAAPEQFVAAVQEQGAQIVAMSALLTTTMPAMQAVIEALADAGLREQVKIMVGGAPLTQDYADQIGADAYADNASSAVRAAKRLIAVN